MNPLLNVGIKAARNAGNIIIRYMDQVDRLAVEKKGENDFVCEVDRAAEDEIIEVVQRAYPHHRIIAQESGSQRTSAESCASQDEVEWIIDPLDGTTNFLHRYPDYAVSIGIRCKGRMEHGIIFNPLRNELFTASRGQGAQLDNRRIRVSGQTHLGNSLVTAGYPARDLPHFDVWLKCLDAMVMKSASIRHTGSAALDLAYVACGRTDAFWQPRLNIWNVAAGSLIVREARGLVADFEGNQDFLDNGNIVCANPKIFNELLILIKTTMSGVL